ncbi:MAG: DUF1365 family protein [Bdellovibrionales bacterium]|nr:DUF1365 family protein [Bdellovibrionales bacterium]
MNSCIYWGETWHQRRKPVVHEFVYPTFCFCIDLAELAALSRESRLFGHNRWSVFSVYDGDYLRMLDGSVRPGSIESKLRSFLAARNVTEQVERIELVTTPRVGFPTFNPVSFYRCFGPGDVLRATVAEVNNTFSESHLYILDEPLEGGAPAFARYRWCKEFHVSPFNDMTGEYRFAFAVSRDELDVRVNIVKDGEAVFFSRMTGSRQPFTSKMLMKTLARYPLTAHLAFPRIVRQAVTLRYEKGLRVYTKPIAASEMTIRRASPSYLQRTAKDIGFSFLRGIRRGELTVVFPDGEEHTFGARTSGRQANIRVRNYDFFVKSLFAGDVGFGESYVDGHWDSDDLTQLLMLFIENEPFISDKNLLSARIGRVVNRLIHLSRQNSKRGSSANIRKHYDLSNELFSRFLDSTMSYSCAVFSEPNEALEAAQRRKVQQMIAYANLQPDDHVLEIGCGWGGLALQAAQTVGCRVTGITLSKEQLEWATARVKEAGLSDRVEVRLCDYRDLQGSFDKIVSIEMLEAVGHEFLGTFFAACDRLLRPNGLVALQVITMPDQIYDRYRLSCDWIQKYIFPGGICPSLTAMTQAMTKHSQFVVQELESIGIHYARTLAEWRERFLSQYPALRAHGFDDRFRRMWLYYLCYCEAGFATRKLNTLQLTLTRTGNGALPACPGYSV